MTFLPYFFLMSFNIYGVKIKFTFLFVALMSFIITLKAPASLLLTIIASLFHEIGHLCLMLLTKNKPKAIQFELTGINIIRAENMNISLKSELLIALGGPLINAFFFVACCLLLCIYENENMLTFACINLILLTFNLLPIKRLDGGIALYFLLSQRFETDFCRKILQILSCIFISLIYLWGTYVFLSTKYNLSVLVVAIFLTLSMFSCNEY